MMEDEQIKNELLQKVHQFLSKEIESNSNLPEAALESLTVAVECIEQAYKFDRQPPSNELLDILKAHKSNSTRPTGQTPDPDEFVRMFQQMAPNFNLANIFSQFSGANPSDANQASQQATGNLFSAPPSSENITQGQQPKVRKQANDAEKQEAEDYKNQGNECMKQDQFKQAYDSYSKAIELDGQNAVYYSNRAAALSKLGDHIAALRDCQEAVEIDPKYSKAYGRMGLAYVSLNDHQKAKDAYIKAVELDPENESYRNNLNIAEERLRGEGTGGGGIAQDQILGSIRRVMSDPESLQGVMSALQNPEVQNTLRNFCSMGLQQFGNLGGGANQNPPPGTS